MVANLNPIDIATQYRIKPNGAAIADDGVTHDGCILCQKAIFAYLRSKSSYRNDESHSLCSLCSRSWFATLTRVALRLWLAALTKVVARILRFSHFRRSAASFAFAIIRR